MSEHGPEADTATWFLTRVKRKDPYAISAMKESIEAVHDPTNALTKIVDRMSMDVSAPLADTSSQDCMCCKEKIDDRKLRRDAARSTAGPFSARVASSKPQQHNAILCTACRMATHTVCLPSMPYTTVDAMSRAGVSHWFCPSCNHKNRVVGPAAGDTTSTHHAVIQTRTAGGNGHTVAAAGPGHLAAPVLATEPTASQLPQAPQAPLTVAMDVNQEPGSATVLTGPKARKRALPQVQDQDEPVGDRRPGQPKRRAHGARDTGDEWIRDGNITDEEEEEDGAAGNPHGLTPDWVISAGCRIFGLNEPSPEEPIIRGLLDPCTNSKVKYVTQLI